MRVFISYKWEDEGHNLWVERLARDLRSSGIDALLDKWEVKFGESFSEYMTRSISEVDAVLFVMTPLSIKAAESPSPQGGAVKFEVQLATARKIAREQFRFIGILRKGKRAANQMRDFRYADFRDDGKYTEMLEMLVRDLLSVSDKPSLGGNGIGSGSFQECGQLGAELNLPHLRAEFICTSRDLVVWNESIDGPSGSVLYYKEFSGKYHCEELSFIPFATRIATNPNRDLIVIREKEGVFVYIKDNRTIKSVLPIERIGEPIIRSEVVHPKFPLVVVGTDYGKVVAWNYERNNIVFQRRYFPRKDIVWISGLAIDDLAGEVLFCVENVLYRIRLSDGNVVLKKSLGTSEETGAIALSKELGYIAIGTVMNASIYKMGEKQDLMYKVQIGSPLVNELRFSPNGKLLGIIHGMGSEGRRAIIVDGRSGKVLSRFNNAWFTPSQLSVGGIGSLSFSDDGGLIAVGEGGRIGIYMRSPKS